jgi:hypothetical protein
MNQSFLTKMKGDHDMIHNTNHDMNHGMFRAADRGAATQYVPGSLSW